MIRLLTGDCRDVLPTLADNSVHCVVTSPPYYALRSYLPDGHTDKHREIGSEPTPEAFVATMVEVFREIRRVMRDDAVAFVNLGDSYHDKQLLMMPARVALALQADGWWLRSDIIWAKPNPMPESVSGSHVTRHMITISDYERLSCLPDSSVRSDQDRPSHLSSVPTREVSDRQATLSADAQGDSNSPSTRGTGRGAREAKTVREITARAEEPSEIRSNTERPGNADQALPEISCQSEGQGRQRGKTSEDEGRSGAEDAAQSGEQPLSADGQGQSVKATGARQAQGCDPGNGNDANRSGVEGDSGGGQRALLLLPGEGEADAGSCDTAEQGRPAHQDERRAGVRAVQLKEERPTDPAGLVPCPGCDKCTNGYIIRLSAGRPTSAYEHVFLLTKRSRYYYDSDAVREDADPRASRSSAPGAKDYHVGRTDAFNQYRPSDRNLRNVWTISTHAFPQSHFATFPPALVERCIRAGTSERGCCAACGAPWVRVTEGNGAATGKSYNDHSLDAVAGMSQPSPNKKGGSEWRKAQAADPIRTTGWSPSCQCNELRCTKCSFVLDMTDARVSSTAEAMRPMREDIPRQEAADDLLQPGLLDDGGSDLAGSRMSVVQTDVPTQNGQHSPLFEALCVEMDGTEPLNDEGLDDNQQGLQAALSSGPSQCEGGWLCDGASGGDGEEAGQASASDRSGASQERGSAGQPDRQSGANGKASARRRQKARLHGDLPMLQGGVPSERQCPHCGSRMEWTTPNVVPATVLDCFSGSGTTALVADRLQRHAIGIDLSTSYADMAARRLELDAGLFADITPPPDDDAYDRGMRDLFAEAAE